MTKAPRYLMMSWPRKSIAQHIRLTISLVEEKIGTDDKPADAKLWRKNPDLGDVDFSSTDWIYTPIIQSGGKYDLKTSATPNSDPLKPGVILASLGIRYKSYCASIGRTFLIDPVKVRF